MAKDIFEGKLGKMLSKYIQICETEFEKAIKIIAENQKKSILNEDYELSNECLETLANCEYYASTCDAANNLCKYIFYNENCNSLKEYASITTIDCDRWNYDYDKFREKIEGIFLQKKLNTKKGFVYIFWSQIPAEYFYVGKTNPKNGKSGLLRFKEDRHSSLVRSSEAATKLTIIFPYPLPSKDDSISDVEASLIRIIGINNLTYNNQEEPFSEGNSDLSERLFNLKIFLGLS